MRHNPSSLLGSFAKALKPKRPPGISHPPLLAAPVRGLTPLRALPGPRSLRPPRCWGQARSEGGQLRADSSPEPALTRPSPHRRVPAARSGFTCQRRTDRPTNRPTDGRPPRRRPAARAPSSPRPAPRSRAGAGREGDGEAEAAAPGPGISLLLHDSGNEPRLPLTCRPSPTPPPHQPSSAGDGALRALRRRDPRRRDRAGRGPSSAALGVAGPRASSACLR